jgi:hypothetical protein
MPAQCVQVLFLVESLRCLVYCESCLREGVTILAGMTFIARAMSGTLR